MKIVGLIPARLQSIRLPEKALIDIEGLPMVIHTCKRAQMAKLLDEIYLTTDSEKIKKVVEANNIPVIMTGSHHPSGTDRIAEACKQIDCDIVANIQGDEPLVNPNHIDLILNEIITKPAIRVVLGITPYTKKNSSSDIKAVLNLDGNVMYCSRADLPSNARVKVDVLWKMCFIVAFQKDFLLQYAEWEPTPLELIEFNEYLRILEHGEKIRAVKLDDAKISVDTHEGLETGSKANER